MTAALIMQLSEESKLSFDHPVSKYMTDLPNADHMTIAQLLEIRSRLYNYTDDFIPRRSSTVARPRFGPRVEALAICVRAPTQRSARHSVRVQL